MKVFVDVVCPTCAHRQVDVFVERGGQLPLCSCGSRVERLWLSAPGITPQGTRPERNTDVARPNRVDSKAIALETTREIEAKMLRYSDPVVAEANIAAEVNAHINDPVPTPAPITAASF